jgi:hypothetical protein
VSNKFDYQSNPSPSIVTSLRDNIQRRMRYKYYYEYKVGKDLEGKSYVLFEDVIY